MLTTGMDMEASGSHSLNSILRVFSRICFALLRSGCIPSSCRSSWSRRSGMPSLVAAELVLPTGRSVEHLAACSRRARAAGSAVAGHRIRQVLVVPP